MRFPNGHEYDFQALRPSMIYCDPLYQRQVNVKRVEKIAKQFNGDIINEPKVSFRDGKYWVFDGQHTLAAWKAFNNNQDKPILCKVYKGMTWLKELETFCQQRGISSEPSTNDKLRAMYNAKDPDVCDMVMRAELCGWVVDFSVNKAIKRIVATSALYKSYKTLSKDDFTEMLSVIYQAWAGDMDAISSQIISAMTVFYKTYSGNFTKENLVSALKKITPAQIIRNGRQYSSRSNTYTREIVKQYNIKRRYKLDEGKL